jgi:hypothetical protein
LATRRLSLRETVRKRAIRGTLASERDANGRVYVYLDEVTPEEDASAKHEPDQTSP